MSLIIHVLDGVCHVQFKGEMTLHNVAELEVQILDAMRRYSYFEVDLSAVEAIDERGIRLLLLMKRLGGKVMRFAGHSSAVLNALSGLRAPSVATVC